MTTKMFYLLYFVINVAIPVFSEVPPGPPNINGPDIIVRGQTIVLECDSVGGSPTPTVKWYKDNTEITDGISTSTSGSTVTTTYTFVATLNDHYEVFECQAYNGVLQNPLKITKFVYVHYTPDAPVLTGPTRLVAGDPGTWTCTSANGYPAGTMTIKNTNTGTTFGPPEYSVTTTAINGGRSFTVVGTLNWNPALSNNNHQLCCDVAHPTTLTTPQSVCLTLAVRAPLAVNAPITSYTPTIGDPVTLQCVVTSGTATIITWFKGSTQLNITTSSRYSNGNVDNPSLTISGVQQSDGGGYTCRASDGSDTVSTNEINVNPQGTPPIVTIPVNSYQETVGNTITLACQVSSPTNLLQSVQWIFTNQNGQVTDPIVITFPKYSRSGSTTTSPSLTITNVQFSDEGTYRSRATNLIGSTSSASTAFLDVQGTPPVFAISPDAYTAVYGSQLVISCTITSANPSVTNIYWIRQSGAITVTINNGDSGYQGSTPQIPSLTIDFVTPAQHTGTYRCLGTNVVDTGVSNQAAVTITEQLTINISPAGGTAIVGDATHTITCQVTGVPSTTSTSWYRQPINGGQQTTINAGNKYTIASDTNNRTLTINNIVEGDEADYYCTATYLTETKSSSRSRLIVNQGILSVTVQPSTQKATIGDASITIQCTIQGSPQATSWEWTKTPSDGNAVVIAQGTNNGKLQVVSSASNPNLIIYNIQSSDAAVYRCRANNGTGQVTSEPSTLTVSVQGAELAINAPITSYTPTIGSTVTLQCVIITGTSSSITWFKGNTQLNIATYDRYSNGNLVNPSLTISSVQQSDAGDYTCRGNSKNVTASSSIINISPQNKQEQNSTVYVAVISALAIALVIFIILSVKCCLQSQSAEKALKSGQNGSNPGTYNAPSGERNPHFYDVTDPYDRIPGQENICNDIPVADVHGTSSSVCDTTPTMDHYHKYTEIM